jgi:hypothetical protein
MRDRLSHSNLLSNPHAAYLFIEDGPGYKGKRLYMSMVREKKALNKLHHALEYAFRQANIQDWMVVRVDIP